MDTNNPQSPRSAGSNNNQSQPNRSPKAVGASGANNSQGDRSAPSGQPRSGGQGRPGGQQRAGNNNGGPRRGGGGGGGRRRNQMPQRSPIPAANAIPVNKSVFNGAEGQQQTQVRSKQANQVNKESKLRIIPLGGLGEIGKNMTAVEYENDMIILDLGSMFATEEQPGVDHIFPDITYLEQNKHKLRGIIITHGHMDHIGGAAYVLPKLNAPIYGTPFTLAMVQKQIEEFHLQTQPQFRNMNPDTHEKVQMGCFSVELVRVGHSIPDATAVVVRTPVGTVIDTGDWRFEAEPVAGQPMDVDRFGEIAKEGVRLLLGDSTNANRAGHTPPEREIVDTLDEIFKMANGRIIISMFASNVNRIQSVVDIAHKHNRKLAITGRSMLANMELAVKLGYINVPKGLLTRLQDHANQDNLVSLCTGSQGEVNAALSRMATGDHPHLKIKPSDTVILSSSPIGSNVTSVGALVDNLLREGARVFQASTQAVDGLGLLHTSGHACHDDLADLIKLLRPEILMPIHGTFAMQTRHAGIALENGVARDKIFVLDNGDTLELTKTAVAKGARVPSGIVLVDGIGVGDVEALVLRDRIALGSDGMVVVIATVDRKTGKLVSSPDIISRGFVHMKESEDLIGRVRHEIRKSFERRNASQPTDWAKFKLRLRDDVSDLLYTKTKRNPMVLPVINEV